MTRAMKDPRNRNFFFFRYRVKDIEFKGFSYQNLHQISAHGDINISLFSLKVNECSIIPVS